MPEVIISDWMMPGMDGLELCRRIRASKAAEFTRFILITGPNGDRDALNGIKAGADDFLSKPLDRHELEIRLIAAGRLQGLHQELRGQQAALESLNAELYKQSRSDPLTLLGNRLRLQEDLDLLKPRIKAATGTYCMALFDVDYFKDYNDSYGHVKGDESLKIVAQLIADGLRSRDAAYRFGGEEFLVILYDVTMQQAQSVVERIRWSVEALGLPHAANPAGVLTISAGVSQAVVEGHGNAEELVYEADQALYAAKANGRNNVQMAQKRVWSSAPRPSSSGIM